MAFDIDQVLQSMTEEAAKIFAQEWPGLQDCVKAALQAERGALQDIATARLNNEISDDDLASELADEKEALTDALVACKVQAQESVQQAVNAALNVLSDAVKAAL